MARTKRTITPSARTKEFATARLENASALKVMKEKDAGVQLAQKAVPAMALASTSTSLLEITMIDALAREQSTEQSLEPKLAQQPPMHRMCPPSPPKRLTPHTTTVSSTIYGMPRRSKVANAISVTLVLTVPPEWLQRATTRSQL
jgi:hypothetical protein